eukprot:COSAG02_NODE_293_length_25438_cov_52.630254_2_plen_191_part_00
MRRNRVAPPIDLMAELEGDDDDPKKQSTLTQQPTLVGTQTAPKPTLTTQKTTVQPTTVASRPSCARTAPRTTVSFRQRTPPAQPSATNRTNYRLFKPLTPAQRKMLETEYYVNKNFYGRDKLYASLQRKHGDAAPKASSSEPALRGARTPPSLRHSRRLARLKRSAAACQSFGSLRAPWWRPPRGCACKT